MGSLWVVRDDRSILVYGHDPSAASGTIVILIVVNPECREA